jgi:hypothetical protein
MSQMGEEPVERSPPHVHSDFETYLLDAKRSLYHAIVLGPPLSSNEAQDMSLLDIYREELRILLTILLRCFEHNNEKSVHSFPEPAKPSIQSLLSWMESSYSINVKEPSDVIPYVHYATYHLQTDPYFLDNYFRME